MAAHVRGRDGEKFEERRPSIRNTVFGEGKKVRAAGRGEVILRRSEGKTTGWGGPAHSLDHSSRYRHTRLFAC
jgi:hypothetical protein